jgi:hypothetical protein
MSDIAKFRLAVWALYYLGVVLHVLVSARASIASDSNSVKTFRFWWECNWKTLRKRLVCDAIALVLWEVSPALLGQIIGHVLPCTYGTAAVTGFAADRFIGSEGFSLGFMKVDMVKVAPAGNGQARAASA